MPEDGRKPIAPIFAGTLKPFEELVDVSQGMPPFAFTPEMPPFAVTQRLVLGALCLIAATWDVARRRIPNLISAAVLVSGLWAQATTGGAMTALGGLGASAVAIRAGVFAALLFEWAPRF